MEDDIFSGGQSGQSGVRLGKLIAQRGVASRRGAEALIESGDVTVNGHVIKQPGTTVNPNTDHVRVEGRPLPPEPKKVYLVLYKPRGMTTGPDEKDRPSVIAMLEGMGLKVDPVGRMEFNTEGALILTNDGDLAYQLTRPHLAVPKRYLAKVYRTPSPKDLAAIERGVNFAEGRSKPAKARVLEQTDKDNAWVEVTVTESGQRVVQRILEQLGHPVSKLRRESYATISIRGMERGQIRELNGEELARLMDVAGGVNPKRAGKNWRKPGFAKPKKSNREGGGSRNRD